MNLDLELLKINTRIALLIDRGATMNIRIINKLKRRRKQLLAKKAAA